MKLNADFTKRAVVHAATLDWQASPMAGVERRMLDRIGDEVARATSIVRYAPGSQFSPHVHRGGEEFLVLEGVFQDEHGDFPAGSYVRNPPGSRHTPGSVLGCTMFVKLRQFDLADRTHVLIDTNKMAPNANSLCRQNSAGSLANLCDLLVRSLWAMPDLLPWWPRTLFSAHLLFLLSQMFQPKPAAHLCDLVEIKIAVCSLCDGSGRITPPAGRRVRDSIAVDCELMNQDRHSLAQSHFQINS